MKKIVAVFALAFIAGAIVLLSRSGAAIDGRAPGPANLERDTGRPSAASSQSGSSEDLPRYSWPSITPSEEYRKLKDQYVAQMKAQLVEPNQSLFHRRHLMGLTAARLFALVDPGTTIGEAERVLAAESSSNLEKLFAVQMLRVLLAEENPRAEPVLVTLADGKGAMGAAAVQALLDGDKIGKYKALYRRYAQDGLPVACQALSYWPDEPSISLLIQVRDAGKGKPAPEGIYAHLAGLAAERAEVLSRPDWAEKASQLIANRQERAEATEWALKVLQMRGRVADYHSILLARLQADEARAYLLDEEANPSDPRFGSLTGDPSYDDILIAFHRSGGKLSPDHEMRLRAFGYLGNPQERLVEVLNRR